MALRAAVHVHSTWSYDGRWELPRIANIFASLGYNLLLMTEHDIGFSEERRRAHRDACRSASSDRILVVPGVEYSDASNTVHVLVWGDIPFLGAGIDTQRVLEQAADHGGVCVFAHPSRRAAWRTFQKEWLRYLTGIEVWNRKTDGWSPSVEACELISRTGALPFVGLDFHSARQLFPLMVMVNIEGKSDEGKALEALRLGSFDCEVFGIKLKRFTTGIGSLTTRVLESGRRVARGGFRFALSSSKFLVPRSLHSACGKRSAIQSRSGEEPGVSRSNVKNEDLYLRSMQSIQNKSYVLVSACRNEEAYIEGLIDAISTQTVRPLRWIIVDDGSTDGTYDRALDRARDLNFVQIVKMAGGRPRSFASQVFAAQHGYEQLKGTQFDFIGFLDADIRVESHYYEQLIQCFDADPGLGLAGGAVIDKYEHRTENIRQGSEDFHVAGGVQFFRRACFEQIGGYIPISGGGQDTIADIMSMMHGWRINAFPRLEALHLRPDGFGNDDIFQRGMKWGRKFYLLGYHPVFYFGQCVRRLSRRPIIIGSACQLLGFVVAAWKSEPRPVSNEFVRFLRQLQMRRMLETLAFARRRQKSMS
jgi:glycosyltransferase involved in cell wall biosynthesis